MCKLCERFWKRFWRHSDAWETAHSNDREMWSKESDQTRELLKAAAAMSETDPAALQLYIAAAEAGSTIAMGRVGWQYWTGTGTAPDLAKAQEYYRRAIQGGSWKATIHYARLLDELGHYGTCDQVLEDGVAVGFIPAYFWLAWLRYKRAETRHACREVRPLLEYAATAGHPGARRKLYQWMFLGRFGPGEILRGILLSFRLVHDYAVEAAKGEPEPAGT
jgi:TPR repeat protein